jgi:hypothetical protein
MIKKWAKILPYFVVMWFTKKFGADMLKNTNFMKDNLRGWRIDKGEWIVWNQDNYDRMTENQRKADKEKLSNKMQKINKMMSKDYSLKQEVRKEIEAEIEQEKEDKMYDDC